MVMAHQRTDIPVALGDAQVVIFGHSHMYQQQEIAGRLWDIRINRGFITVSQLCGMSAAGFTGIRKFF